MTNEEFREIAYKIETYAADVAMGLLDDPTKRCIDFGKMARRLLELAEEKYGPSLSEHLELKERECQIPSV